MGVKRGVHAGVWESWVKNPRKHSHMLCKTAALLTMSGPHWVPSAAGMNFVSHFLPIRWHHRALQMS